MITGLKDVISSVNVDFVFLCDSFVASRGCYRVGLSGLSVLVESGFLM